MVPSSYPRNLINMFPNQTNTEIKIGDQVIKIESGRLAPQANGSALVTWGNTVVLATVVLGQVDQTKDYFPLSVEFVDKLYAGGIIKGSKWIKREGNLSDNSILFGRIIDRSVRPLFPSDFRNEVQLIVTVLSNDKEHDVIIPAFIAASAALGLSDIPFKSPVSIVRVGRLDNQFVINPTIKQLTTSSLDILVCTGPGGVNMIEAQANIIENDIILEAIELAKNTGETINGMLTGLFGKSGKAKIIYSPVAPPDSLLNEVGQLIESDLKSFYQNGIDGSHQAGIDQMFQKITDHFQIQIDQKEIDPMLLKLAFEETVSRFIRNETLKGNRFDKRLPDQIRPITTQVGLLPCTHGSALFQRGLTQALTITTLSSLADQQYLEDSLGESTKRYLHYYSAAPFSTGQTGRLGRPGRREIGHGALAEKALLAVIPKEADFPYTIALTSEVLSQNGSSSMASTCGSTLSLMDAGVPITDKVAGISVGMMSDGQGKYLLLTDIAGLEDHYGDMDFKIAGTRTGITAIQLDIKIEGLSLDMIKDTFVASTKARMEILDKIDETLSAPRPQLSPLAPKVKLIELPEDKVGEVIGSGGKTIKGLMEKYQVKIDIDDNNNALVSGINAKGVDDAVFEIESMIREVQIGEEFDGQVTRVEPYGAFIEFLPGREALLHVSEMTGGFLSDPSSIIKVGDRLKVSIAGYNDNHQIKLSAAEFKASHPGSPRSGGFSPPSRTGPSSRPAFSRQRSSTDSRPRR